MKRHQSGRASGRRGHHGFAAIAFALAALAATAPSPAAAQGAGSGAEWSTPSGTLQATRYSTLADISSANVARLVEEFSVPTGTRGAHQGQPLVVGGRMYIVTPYPNRLIALDLAHPGLTLWTFDPKPREYARGVACCDVVNRGAVYADGKVIFNTLDDQVVAVDAVKGTLVWRTRLGDPTTGETMTGAPVVVKDKVIVGNAGAELGVRGWVQALDLKTGKPSWKAYNTGPDADVKIGAGFKAFYPKDQGSNLGTTSWPATMWQQGGATAWNWFSYDPGLDLLYYGTAQPGVWNPDMRPGDNKWGSTIFARRPSTGEAVWAYQVTPHDGWDYDSISESIVADLPIGGATRQVIVHFDKNGFAYTMDRATGQVLTANKFAYTTWADSIDLATGAPVLNPAMLPHEGVVTKGICPSPLGGKEFVPASFSPATQLFYVPAINFCNNLEPLKAMYIAGTPFMGADIDFAPGPGGFLGELVAWNAATGQRAWSVKEPLPLYGGTLATAGNLVFYGTLDKHFKAVDATTGQVLLDKTLECGIVGNPISFAGADGRQRIAVYAGTGWLTGGFAGGACPRGSSEGSTTTTGGGRLHVFKLP